jgi:hypothetical protein
LQNTARTTNYGRSQPMKTLAEAQHPLKWSIYPQSPKA